MPSLLTIPRELQNMVVANFSVHCTPTTNAAQKRPRKSRLPPISWFMFAKAFDDHEPDRHDRAYQATLANLCLVSKACQDLATPYLYHRPLPADGPQELLVSLARTILRKPSLALHVRHLSQKGWYRPACFFTMPEMSLAEIRLFKSAAAKCYEITDSSYADIWLGVTDTDPIYMSKEGELAQFYDGNERQAIRLLRFESSLASLLMSACLNLEEITLVTRFHPSFCLPSPGNILPRLRSLEVEYDIHREHMPSAYSGTTLGDIDLVLSSAPNLARLAIKSLHKIDRTPRVTVPWSSLPSTEMIPSTLRELTFDHSMLTHSELQTILDCCPSLEKLRTHIAYSVYPKEVVPSLLQKALVSSKCASTIRTLDVDLSPVLPGGPSEDEDRRIVSLASLRALEELIIDVTSIWPGHIESETARVLVDLLPASIRTFRLFPGRIGIHTPTVLFAAVMELARSAPAYFPALRTVEVCGLDYAQAKKAKAVFEKHGVAFSNLTARGKKNGVSYESAIVVSAGGSGVYNGPDWEYDEYDHGGDDEEAEDEEAEDEEAEDEEAEDEDSDE
ncbi:hypothetical protein B0T22DRAFT_480063 [Podospora appendiculata]|uniref:Uncharacterized protein n=1 Tax=Podospora appendiculata TaxID=314037 RepID=A0AAE0XA63_9PEZI|nr:hypothetical protein B0T22DRAFT_480063 [Podospora appendiculata]